MSKRTPSPQETKIINTHVAAILEELNAAGIYSNAVLAFITLNGWDYHLATMIGREVDGDVDEAINALIKYAHDELCDMISVPDPVIASSPGVEHRAAKTATGRVEGIVMDRVVTESMGWRERLESVRTIPREGADRISISVKMLDDVIEALDHLKKLEAGIRECESDGGCRATKFVEEAGQRPLN